MKRRSLFLGSTGALLVARAASASPLDGSAPLAKKADAPPPTKIRRLFLWLPNEPALMVVVNSRTERLFDFKAFSNALATQLQARNVEVRVATHAEIELDRQQELLKALGQYQPTHRIEVRAKIISSRDLFGEHKAGIVSWVLYDGTDTTSLRARVAGVSAARDDSVSLATDAAKRLEIEGFL